MPEPRSAKACPSYECKPGAGLLGVVLPDGRVAFSSETVTINDEFVKTASVGRAPENRFRFTGPCVHRRCGHWTGDACGLIRSLVASEQANGERGTSPEVCPIKSTCRWYAEHADAACAICPSVVRGVASGEAEPTPSPHHPLEINHADHQPGPEDSR